MLRITAKNASLAIENTSKHTLQEKQKIKISN
jgi:hypothetical protein